MIKAAVKVKGKMLTILMSTASAMDVMNSVEVFTLFIDVSRTPETSEFRYFVRLFYSFQTLTNVAKNSLLDAAGIVVTPLLL